MSSVAFIRNLDALQITLLAELESALPRIVDHAIVVSSHTPPARPVVE